MDAPLIALKVVATPLIIALVTFVERRFGPAAAGLVFGLPLTSALASAFLAAEQGAGFARDTTAGLLAGLATYALFIGVFANAAARGARWPLALALALVAYVPAAVGASLLAIGRGPALALGLTALGLATATLPRRLAAVTPRLHGRWELPLRMAIATALIVVLTAVASLAGPRLTGVLLLVPASTSTIACFVLARAGPAAVVQVLRGLAWGCFSFVAFYVVLGTALGTMATGLAFALAGLAAIGCSGLTYRLAISRHAVKPEDALD